MCEHDDRGSVNNIYEFQSFVASGTEYISLPIQNKKMRRLCPAIPWMPNSRWHLRVKKLSPAEIIIFYSTYVDLFVLRG